MSTEQETIDTFDKNIHAVRKKLVAEDCERLSDYALLRDIENFIERAFIAAKHISDEEVRNELLFSLAAFHHDNSLTHHIADAAESKKPSVADLAAYKAEQKRKEQ